jgi:hypothetical protein
MTFAVAAAGRPCCGVETVYVYTDADGVPQPVPYDARAMLIEDPPASRPG